MVRGAATFSSARAWSASDQPGSTPMSQIEGASLDPRSPPSQVLKKWSLEEAQDLKSLEVMVLFGEVRQIGVQPHGVQLRALSAALKTP